MFLDNWSVEFFLLPLLESLYFLKDLDISNNHIDDEISATVLKKILKNGGECIDLHGNEFYDDLSNTIVSSAFEIKKVKRINLKACKQEKPPKCLEQVEEGAYKQKLLKLFKKVIPSPSRRVFLKREKGYIEILI